MHSMATRSSLELMLDKLQQKTEQKTEDLPPALPFRPVSKARLPPGKRARPIKFQEIDLTHENRKNQEITRREAKQECSYGDNGGCLIQKTGTMDYTPERELKGILGIQKYFRGHQARCCYHELKRRIITLQSFVRAENARNKKNIAGRTLQTQQTAVILLQSVIRGWLSRRHLKCTENMKKLSTENAEKKDYVHIPYSNVLDLQRRVLKTEAAAQYKKEANAGLRLQLEKYEKKWQQSEAKMKSLEQMWQDQLTSIQVSLAEVAKRSTHAAENAANQIGIMDYTTLHHDINVDHTMHTAQTGQLGLDINPEDGLRKLKLRFEAWKKDYKNRLHETKATFQKIGATKVGKSSKKWYWGI